MDAIRRQRQATATLLARRPGLQVAAVLGLPMLFCFVDRLASLSAIKRLYPAENHSFGRQLSGILLGIAEDFVVATLLAVAILVVEVLARVVQRFAPDWAQSAVFQGIGYLIQCLVVFVLVALVLTPFASDLRLARKHKTRLSTDTTHSHWLGAPAAVCFAIVFTLIYASGINLVRCFEDRADANYTKHEGMAALASSRGHLLSASTGGGEAATPQNAGPIESSDPTTDDDLTMVPLPANPETHEQEDGPKRRRRVKILLCVVVFAAVVVAVGAISHAASLLVAAIGLNATLEELSGGIFGFHFLKGVDVTKGSPNANAKADAAADYAVEGSIESAAKFLNSDTESYTLFKDDVLYRKTTGFKGPLTFDVEVDESNLPNVLIIGIESYRYLDSLYLAANTTAGELMQKNNLTVTPQFDRWAKRGIAFNNMWSSWQTSRSLEAILFGQLTLYTNASGTAGGRVDTELSGMPQFFKQKGYETVFTTGCIVTFDEWDSFLPAHGFDTLIAAPEMKQITQRDYGINSSDWGGPARRGFSWGVHDDVSFDILGDLMINKTKEQAERVKSGKAKKPFFLNHYTISSHHEFNAWPQWVDNLTLPDYTPLCEGWQVECELIKKYTRLRYFTDLELGKFMDRMENAGILNDTIVIMVGDHGQSPEFGLVRQLYYQTSCQHVASAIVAEGRLGKYAGTMIDDVTHQYDFLNTMMDIIGVPEGGFLQTGIGRSLKRQIPVGEHLVYSNNPKLKMSIVRGHERLVHDRDTSDARLYNTIKDPLEEKDLFPARSSEEQAEWLERRKAARQLSTYFKLRWAGRCLTQVDC